MSHAPPARLVRRAPVRSERSVQGPRRWSAAMSMARGGVALALLVGSIGYPAGASAPIPDVYGLYAIEGDQLVDGAQAPDVELGPSVRFLFFGKAVALGDTDISLRRSAY